MDEDYELNESQLEGEELEQEGEVPESEQTEDDGLVEISYTDADGEEVTERVKLEDLVEGYKSGKQNSQLQEHIQKQQKYINDVQPFVNTVNDSDLVKQIFYYKNQGYTDTQIKQGLPQIWQQAQKVDETLPDFDDVQDKRSYIDKIVNQNLQNKIMPLQEQITRVQNEKAALEEQIKIEKTIVENDKVFDLALSKAGLKESDLTKEDRDSVAKTIQQLYSDKDLRKERLTLAQAHIIIGDALRNKIKAAKNKPVNEAKSANRQNAAPNILPNMTSTGKNAPSQNSVQYFGEGEQLDKF
jgi:hypothetical protein